MSLYDELCGDITCCSSTPERWLAQPQEGETFVEFLVRSFTIEELKDVKATLETAIATPGRIRRRDLRNPAPYIAYTAGWAISGIMCGRGSRHGDCGWYDTSYVTAKGQYKMVLDAVCEALSVKS